MKLRYYTSINKSNIRRVEYRGNIQTLEILIGDSSFISFNVKANRQIAPNEISIKEGEDEFNLSVFGKSEGLKGRVEINFPKGKNFIMANEKFKCVYNGDELIIYKADSEKIIANYSGTLKRLHIGGTIKASFVDRTVRFQI